MLQEASPSLEPMFRARAARAVGRGLRGMAPHGAVILWDQWRALDLAAVEPLRRAPLEVLRDPVTLEREVLPAVGVVGHMPAVFPAELAPHLGRGLRCWQHPRQFAPYLVALSQLPIQRYCELGVMHGGTFVATVEYLSRFRPLRQATAVDVSSMLALRRYRRPDGEVRLARLDTGSPEFPALLRELRPDLVLIDADHTYEAVRRDFGNVHGIANAIAFHDLVDSASPGVGMVWREICDEHRDTYDFMEFVEQYPEVTTRLGGTVLGIGLAVRKGFIPPRASL